MRQVRKTMHCVAAALAVAGLVLMASGFALSVFTASVDRGAVMLGGVEVENPEQVPLLGWMASMGRVEINPPEAPDAPTAP